MKASDSRQTAHRALTNLSANGGRLRLQPIERDGLPRVIIDFFEPGANRERCRAMVVDMKASPAVWAEVVAILGRAEEAA